MATLRAKGYYFYLRSDVLSFQINRRGGVLDEDAEAIRRHKHAITTLVAEEIIETLYRSQPEKGMHQ